MNCFVSKVVNICSEYNNLLIYNVDRLKSIDCSCFLYNLNEKYRLFSFSELFFSFLKNCNIFYLFENNKVNLLNTYFKCFYYYLFNICKVKKEINTIESFNFFCKFSYSRFYNKLVVKFSRYDTKLIVFRTYGNSHSSINFDYFLTLNEKNDKVCVNYDYFNFFSCNILNIRKSNEYTGKGIRRLNDSFKIKVRKKIK